MPLDNYAIADQFSLLAKLMDIHGENSFKSKSYSVAAFNIEKITTPLHEISPDKLFTLKGIGESTGRKIIEILDTGKLQALEDMLLKTPPGILDLLNIKGLGPKKISTIWKEMGIESVGELLYACNENRLTLLKGFGEKTQKSVQENIEFFLRNVGSYLYAQIEGYAHQLLAGLANAFGDDLLEITGDFRRQNTIISKLEFVTTKSIDFIGDFFSQQNFVVEEVNQEMIAVKGPENILLVFYIAAEENFYYKLLETSSAPEFYEALQKEKGWSASNKAESENDIFKSIHFNFVPAYLRDSTAFIERAKQKDFSDIIHVSDIKGIIHNHSNWSDGVNTVEEMAKACIAQGYEYLVISDHSKTAAYAKGLQEDRVREQHLYIDELNAKLHPFKIFKSIESDILNDGSLDYSNEVLATFDLVIGSVHQNLSMPEDKAMMRLLSAIRNPYTTILGHMTGRLLLSRKGYPVDHKEIIKACVENNVVIELNAHPSRLDIDWCFIDDAIAQGALISINPDAHSIDGFHDVKYGVLAAQKGGLTREKNLSSFSLAEFEKFLSDRRIAKKI
ncbi:helix-hairpin-helix domain-containing protein [Pinibacter soli]|uniref:Helix-hairpin-helix domain-containing protein n=1 Tax=Pinibacter soli TaxID=3044211 RepID=A0ABT6RI11_9BACT|nr:helix-hairpin-helix domain-containing protein [Pinibacter soli]MDI3322056.1 helix-hairpin-helix domain-containing protein [Pinibacter soli]